MRVGGPEEHGVHLEARTKQQHSRPGILPTGFVEASLGLNTQCISINSAHVLKNVAFSDVYRVIYILNSSRLLIMLIGIWIVTCALTFCGPFHQYRSLLCLMLA